MKQDPNDPHSAPTRLEGELARGDATRRSSLPATDEETATANGPALGPVETGAQPLSWDSARLKCFHGTFGRALPVPIPPSPPKQIAWNAHYRVERLLGNGAQGVVYLARREGVDGYFTRVAVKIFYPRPEYTRKEYLHEMARIARQAKRVSGVQHDNLISVRDFVAIDGTRVMVLEWVDGIDVRQLLDLRLLTVLKRKLGRRGWERVNDVILTAGEDHCRVRSGVAVDIIHGCLSGLSALHQSGIAHCDLKPSNIMIKRTGLKKIIDIDSSSVLSESRHVLRGTPYYMAPEQLRREPMQLRSDIASLGYVLIEMLTGTLLFRECRDPTELLRAKLELPHRLEKILPQEVLADRLLFGLVSKMVAADPAGRFADADAADLDKFGAVNFQRQLVRYNLATEYDRELAWLINSIGDGSALSEQEELESLATTQPLAEGPKHDGDEPG